MFILSLFILTHAKLKVELSTQWKGPTMMSLIQEMSEYFSEIDRFWFFINKIEKLSISDYTIEEIAEKASRNLIEKRLLLSSLYNREFSARMEFYSKLETQDRLFLSGSCYQFYKINSITSCMMNKGLFSSPQIPKSNDFDHVLYQNSQNTLIVYIDISDLKKLQEIKQFCIENNSKLIIRHIDLRNNSKDYLSGYAVELSIKNMEYKNVEDPSADWGYQIMDWDPQGIV